MEILFGTDDRAFYNNDLIALNLHGEELWKYSFHQNYGTGSSPIIVDLDGDNNLDIIMVTMNYSDNFLVSNLLIINNYGIIKWSYQLIGYSWTSPPVADLNLDGKLEIIMGVYEANDSLGNIHDYSKLGLYVFGDMTSTDLIDKDPDLAIKPNMVDVSQSSISQMKVIAKVANAGLIEATNVEIEVRTNTQIIGIETIDIIPPLSLITVEFNWTGGAIEIFVTIDSNDEIIESNEDNNETSKTL